MEDKIHFKKAILKEKISELRTKKFSFEINRIELPNGHEDEYGQIIFPNAALAVPIQKKIKLYFFDNIDLLYQDIYLSFQQVH